MSISQHKLDGYLLSHTTEMKNKDWGQVSMQGLMGDVASSLIHWHCLEVTQVG